MHRFLLFALAVISLSPSAQAKLEIHNPHHYDILKPNSSLECRFVADNSFGYLFERGGDDRIQVSLITNGVNEGSKSAFTVAIKAQEAIGLHLYLYERTGQFGRFVEFELRNQRDSFLKYDFPGLAMQVSAMYEPDGKGGEKENLYPDLMKRMACRIL